MISDSEARTEFDGDNIDNDNNDDNMDNIVNKNSDAD